jgi:hypothetical protein
MPSDVAGIIFCGHPLRQKRVSRRAMQSQKPSKEGFFIGHVYRWPSLRANA